MFRDLSSKLTFTQVSLHLWSGGKTHEQKLKYVKGFVCGIFALLHAIGPPAME